MNELIAFRSEIDLTPTQFRLRVREDYLLQKLIERLYNKYLPDYPKLNKGCSSCWEDAYIALKTIKLDKIMNNLSKEYILKAGVVLRNGNILINRHNLTDAIAEEFLRGDEALLKYFERYPSDWRERIAPPKSDKEAKNEDLQEVEDVVPQEE